MISLICPLSPVPWKRMDSASALKAFAATGFMTAANAFILYAC